MRDINIFDTDMFPYLEGEEIKDTTLTLHITDIKPDKLKSHSGKMETKEVLYFKETPKGFVLNKTNAKRIAQMYGAMTGQWAGKQITLTTEIVQAFGETHNALRVVPGVIGTTDEMTLDKLLAQLNRVDRIKGFYKTPADILACRAEGTGQPAADDLDGWRVLFSDARNYALDEIQQAVDDGQPVPGSNGDDRAKFFASTAIDLGLTDEQALAILRELGREFEPDKAEDLFALLDGQINQGVTTETGLLVMANREGGHYKNLRHLRNTVKKINLGLDYPPRADEPVNWQTFLAGLIEHAAAPKEYPG